MENPNLSWIKDREMCSASVCIQMHDYVGTGKIERVALRKIAEDRRGQFTLDQIYARYRYYVKGHAGGSMGKPQKNKFPSAEELEKIDLIRKFTEGCSAKCKDPEGCRQRLMDMTVEYLKDGLEMSSQFSDAMIRICGSR